MLAKFINSSLSVLVIFLLTATGFFCGKKKWMTPESKKFISKLLMNLAVPCMSIYGLRNNMDRETLGMAAFALFVPIICIGTNYIISYFLSKLLNLPRKRQGVFMMMCSMSNSMFIGYAMCTELFGEACVPSVMLYYMISTTYTQVVGVSLVRWSASTDKVSPKTFLLRVLKTPCVDSIFIAFFLILLDVQLPQVVMSYLKYMNALVTPLSLLLMGYSIYNIGLKNVRLDLPTLVICFYRFVFAPLLFFGMCCLFGVTGLTQKVFIVEASMPVLLLAVVTATEYGADADFASQGAAITTLLSFIDIPILMLLLG